MCSILGSIGDTGLGGGKRLAQAKNITIELKEEVAVQIDGEPWMQDPCTECVMQNY